MTAPCALRQSGMLVLAGVLLVSASAAAQVQMPTGTISLPATFTLRPLRGTDSSPGTIVRAGGGMVIQYDIGGMAGSWVVPARKESFLWMTAHEVDGRVAYTGLARDSAGVRTIATTILGESRDDAWTLPANFSAEVRDERDVAEFMAIVTSYRPKKR